MMLRHSQSRNGLSRGIHSALPLRRDNLSRIGSLQIKLACLDHRVWDFSVENICRKQPGLIKEPEVRMGIGIVLPRGQPIPIGSLLYGIRIGIPLKKPALVAASLCSLEVQHTKVVLCPGMTLLGRTEIPVGSGLVVLINFTAHLGRVLFSVGVNDPEVMLGAGVVAPEKSPFRQRLRSRSRQQKGRQRLGPVNAKDDLHSIVCVRQFFRILRWGATELKRTDCVGPAVEVEEHHELNRLGQWHFSRVENPDVDQQVAAFTAKIHHGDVSSLGRVVVRVEHRPPETLPGPLDFSRRGPVVLRLRTGLDEGHPGKRKGSAALEADSGHRESKAHPIAGRLLQLGRRQSIILSAGFPTGMDFSEVGACHCAARPRRLFVPLNCGCLAGCHAHALFVENPKGVHRAGMIAQPNGLSIILDRPADVVGDAGLACPVKFAQAKRRLGVAGCRGRLKPFQQGRSVRRSRCLAKRLAKRYPADPDQNQ